MNSGILTEAEFHKHTEIARQMDELIKKRIELDATYNKNLAAINGDIANCRAWCEHPIIKDFVRPVEEAEDWDETWQECIVCGLELTAHQRQHPPRAA